MLVRKIMPLIQTKGIITIITLGILYITNKIMYF